MSFQTKRAHCVPSTLDKKKKSILRYNIVKCKTTGAKKAAPKKKRRPHVFVKTFGSL